MRTLAEQIAALTTTRAAKLKAMQALTTKADDEGRTLEDSEQTTIDEHSDEIDRIDADLVRLERMQKQLAGAKPVQRSAAPRAPRADDASRARDPHVEIVTPKREKGIAFARYVKCIGLAAIAAKQGEPVGAHVIAKSLYQDRDPEVVAMLEARSQRMQFVRAPVLAGTGATGNWAEGLVGEETGLFADFVEFLRPQTILGRFGTDGIPSLRRVPFRVPLIGQTGGGRGYWVGNGAGKPVTSFDFERDTIEPRKVANIVVATMELIRDSSPSADPILRDSLAAALRERMDTDFINPAQSDGSPEAGGPASITNGVATPNSSGNTADDVRADVKTIMAAFVAANNPPTSGVWIMPTTVALSLSLMVNALGNAEFPGITMRGGTFFGLPVITSEYVPTLSAGAYVFLVNASDIYFADEGEIAIDMSQEASLQMDTAPTQSSATPTATSVVSLWQTNSVGFRAERTVNWQRRRDSAVAGLDTVNWGD
jgi:predicted phage gp36 major capsid-like protein